MGFSQLGRGHLRQAKVFDLALLHQARHGLHGFHNRNAEVTAVHVVEVDHVRAEPPQAGVHRLPDVGGVSPDVGVTVGRRAHQGELGGQLDLIPPVLQQLRDEFLVAAPAVDVRGVDEADTGIHGMVQGSEGIGRVNLPVHGGKCHPAESQGADHKAVPEVNCWCSHGRAPFVVDS